MVAGTLTRPTLGEVAGFMIVVGVMIVVILIVHSGSTRVLVSLLHLLFFGLVSCE